MFVPAGSQKSCWAPSSDCHLVVVVPGDSFMRNVGVRLLCAVPSVLLVVSVMNPGAAAEGASPEPPAADASRAAAPLGKDCEVALSTTLKSLDPCDIRFTYLIDAAEVDEEGYCVPDRDQFY